MTSTPLGWATRPLPVGPLGALHGSAVDTLVPLLGPNRQLLATIGACNWFHGLMDGWFRVL